MNDMVSSAEAARVMEVAFFLGVVGGIVLVLAIQRLFGDDADELEKRVEKLERRQP